MKMSIEGCTINFFVFYSSILLTGGLILSTTDINQLSTSTHHKLCHVIFGFCRKCTSGCPKMHHNSAAAPWKFSPLSTCRHPTPRQNEILSIHKHWPHCNIPCDNTTTWFGMICFNFQNIVRFLANHNCYEIDEKIIIKHIIVLVSFIVMIYSDGSASIGLIPFGNTFNNQPLHYDFQAWTQMFNIIIW